jgi:hypothetical protein
MPWLLQGSTETIMVNGTPRSDSMTHSGGGGGVGTGGGTSSGNNSGMRTNSFGAQSSARDAGTSV